MNTLFPGKAPNQRPEHFRAFRNRLKKAAEEAEFSIELVTDDTRNPPDQRTCWLTGEPTPVDELAQDYPADDVVRDTRDYNGRSFQAPWPLRNPVRHHRLSPTRGSWRISFPPRPSWSGAGYRRRREAISGSLQ